MIESAVGVELVPVLGPFLWSAGGGGTGYETMVDGGGGLVPIQ